MIRRHPFLYVPLAVVLIFDLGANVSHGGTRTVFVIVGSAALALILDQARDDFLYWWRHRP